MKIDIEGYECKVWEVLNRNKSQTPLQALQPDILHNQVGKFIPYIFIEWIHLPQNKVTCANFTRWVANFVSGGYIPVDPGESV